MTPEAFAARLRELADAWTRRDYAQAAAMFAPDIVYVDPLRYRLASRDGLRRFFENDDGLPQRTQWHSILFDPAQRLGCAEYSYTGTHAYHGVVLVRVTADGLFERWREYQHVVDAGWRDWWGAAVD